MVEETREPWPSWGRAAPGTSAADVGRLGFGEVGGELPRPRDEIQRSLHHDMTLPVQGDHMIAVVEHDRLDKAGEIALQVFHIAQARPVVLPWMHDERGLVHVGGAFLHLLDEPAEL